MISIHSHWNLSDRFPTLTYGLGATNWGNQRHSKNRVVIFYDEACFFKALIPVLF